LQESDLFCALRLVETTPNSTSQYLGHAYEGNLFAVRVLGADNLHGQQLL
jgi:hypothetical protein